MNKFTALKNIVTSKVARQALLVQKNSPGLLFGTGLVGFAATTVLASRATLRMESVLDKHEEGINTAKALHESNNPAYSDNDLRHDLVYIHVRTAVSVGKLYGPSLLTAALTVGCLTKSHSILTQRNVALTAAYAAVERGFAEYRARVVNEFGEDKDRELRYSSESRDVLVDTETGPQVKTETRVNAEDNTSMYAKFFGPDNQNWNRESSYNVIFLRCQQNYANDRLQSKGFVLLNDVYDMLGFERTSAGCVVGWVKGAGDNFIDFGLFDREHMDRFHDFVTGREGVVLLDFNVDGIVYDKI